MGILDIIKKKPEPATVPQQTKTYKIIVIEDEKELREFYTTLLTGEGYIVLNAENGQTGLELIRRENPDLVILDLMMPVMDGKTMLRELRNIPEYKSLPTIILTNAGDVDSMRETRFYSHADDFLIKSNVTPPELIQKVKSNLL